MVLFALILAILGGVFFGVFFPLGMVLIGIPMDAQDGLMSGLLFGGMCWPALILIFRQQRKRFQMASQKLPSPCTHRFSLLLMQGKKSLPIALFLCEDCLCLVDIDKRALPMTVYPSRDIIRAITTAPNHLEIHLTEDRTLLLRGAADPILLALKERGWLPFQH